MAKRIRRYGVGMLAVGTLAGAVALVADGITMRVPAETFAFPAPPAAVSTPAAVSPAVKVTTAAARNLHVSAEKLVPRKVAAGRPARIVTTTIGAGGRPVITVHTARDRAAAVARVRQAQRAKGAVGVELDVPVKAAEVGVAGDPYRGYQWDLDTVHAPEAWARTTGAGVTVAVVDSGVDGGHLDLTGQVLPGADLTTGIEGPTRDVHGHGTHVAGTIAAATGNGVGIAGVAPDVKILPVRVLGDDGSGYMSVAAAGVVWAADHGADVINLSISGASAEQSMTYAIAYARSRGAVVVAAAGNDRQKGSPASYPAAEPGVIAVAATDRSDDVAPFSTAGDYVDIAAPGYGIVSTFPGNRYMGMSGTSMAAPHVAAAAALVRSLNHSLTPDQVEQVLESSAVDRGAPGHDSDYGSGRLDLTAALAAVTTPPAAAPETAPAEAAPAAPEPAPSAPSTPEAAPPAAAPTPAKTPSTNEPSPVDINAGAPQRVAVLGDNTATTFTVSAVGEPFANRPVDLCVSVDNAEETCTRAVTATDGTVTWNQPATAPFRVRLAVPGSGSTATVAYRVRATATLAADGPDSMLVTVQGVDGQGMVLQQLNGTIWQTVRTFPAQEQVQLTGLAHGTYRVILPMTNHFNGMVGAAVRL